MAWGEGLLDAFQCVGWGAVLLGADGCVISLNREAQRHVGIGIILAQGRIAATERSANSELQRLVAAALSTIQDPSLPPREGLALPCAGGHPIMAYAIPVAGSGRGSRTQGG